VIELMGHKAGWLALYAGIAGGGDVILIPEIPYDIQAVCRHIKNRAKSGKTFSVVVVAEGAISIEEAAMDKRERKKYRQEKGPSVAYRVAHEIEERAGKETRATVLGYVQRGGIPCASDRVLATSLGTAAAELLAQGVYGRMVALHGNDITSVDLSVPEGKVKPVPVDHYMVDTAMAVGTCMGTD
jgi:6-phosphofructokinase 1